MDQEVIDLSYLTVGERKHLLSVLDADEELRIRRMGFLKDGSRYKLSTSYRAPSNGQSSSLKQLQIKLEIDHIFCSELLRNSLKAAGVNSREFEERILRENIQDRYSSNGTLHEYKGEYEITGQVLVGVYYKDDELHIHVDRACDLAVGDSNGYSDPYIKTYLLPDRAKQTKRKTSIKKMTLNPVYDETLKYKPSELELSSQTLWLSVWDWDRFSTNQFLGEIHLPLFSLDLNDTGDHWYQLQDNGGGSQTTLQNSLAASVEWPRHREESPLAYKSQNHLSRREPSQSTSAITEQPVTDDKHAHVLVASNNSRPPAGVVSMKSGRHRTGESLQHTQSATPTLASQVATSASIDRENVHIAKSTETIDVHTQSLGMPVEPNIHVHVSLAENEQSLPQCSSLVRLKQTKNSSLVGSTTSIYSEAGGKGDYAITGEVMMALSYRDGELHIHVDRARGLAAGDSNGYSNPYIKTYLLPDKDKRTKLKTSIKKKTLDPIYGEILKYKVSSSEINSRTLWLSVWDWDKFGRNQFLGEVRLPLFSLDLTVSGSQWYTLQDKDDAIVGGEMDAFDRGELKVGIKYQPSGGSKATGTLVIDINKAKELQAVKGDAINSVVKLYLLPNRKSSGKRKTSVIKHNKNPVWEEKFTFEDVNLEELSRERVLEVSVWNYDKISHTFIGGLRIGPAPRFGAKQYDWMDSIDDEVTHWEDMLACPGKWVEQWHTLRTTLNPRNINRRRSTPPSLSISGTPSVEDIIEDEVRYSTPAKRRDTISCPEESLTHSQVSSLLGLHRPESIGSLGSMTSIYSEAGGKGDYDITGEVQVGVFYKDGDLYVHVNQAEGLAAAKSKGYSDPYFKTYLLPDKAKQSKQKTSVKKRTLDPVYNETLKYELSESELSSRTLWLSAWDWDRFGRNQFLGEVRFPLSSLDLTDMTDKWYFMQDMDVESNLDEMYKGQLKISMQFSPACHTKKSREQGTLRITIGQAKDFQEPVDSFVKLYLLPDKSSKGKRKTKIIKSSIKPAWEETFTYEKVQLDDLSFQRALEVTVWKFHKRSGNVFIGGLRVGPAPGSAAKHKDWMDSIGVEVTHWEDMLAHPGEWVEQWHTLRTTMNPRDIMLPH